jgi:hypothetical protein
MTTELSKPKGHGIVRVAHNLRVHAYRPQDWGAFPATDYWANWGDLTFADAAASDLVANGWLTSGFSHLASSGADFISSSDVGTTGGLNFDAVSDYMISPFIFGDYAHALLAGQILGYMPTELNMECYARFAANNDEEETGFGLLEAGTDANALVKADLMAFVTSDGTNFSLESGAAAAASDGLDSTTPHQFKVTLSGTTAKWWIDGTLQTNTLAIQNDLWPCAWGAGTKAATGANDPVINWVHIWYS